MFTDLRHACRVFAKNPGFTAIAVMSIAFGTGANVAIFSAADALLLRPLPVVRPSELMTVGTKVRFGLSTQTIASYPDYVDIRDRTQTFDGLIAFASRTAGFTFAPGAPPKVSIATLVSGNFFRVLGVTPQIGRDFRADEDLVPGRDAVTVLSYGMWNQEFGRDPSVVGRHMRIAGVEFTIVGVTPESFTGINSRFVPEAAFVPLAMWPRLQQDAAVDPLRARDSRSLTLKGRLKPGISLREARAELAAIGADLERAYPDTNRDKALDAQTEIEMRYLTHPLDSSLVVILSVLSIAVLCVACANVAGLLSSRAPVRAREVALRMAIGAGRGRIVRQLITESLGIAVVGAAAGLAVGYAGILLLHQYEIPIDLIAVPPMQLDRRALTFSLILAVASAFMFGLVPALQTTRVDLVNSLKTGDSSAVRRHRLTGRNVLVGLQVAASLVLLTVTAFALQVFSQELTEGPGFRTTQMAKLTIDPEQARYTPAEAARFFARVVEGARRMPGVTSAGVTASMPLGWVEPPPQILPEGYTPPNGEPSVQTWLTVIDEGYFEAMAIPIVAGRGFRAGDGPDAPRVAIVNETFARKYWPVPSGVEGPAGPPAIGRHLRIDADRAPWIEVVGIAKTTKYFYPGESAEPMLYLPFRQEPRGSMVLLAATAGDSASVVTPLREMLRALDPNVPVHQAETIERFYGNSFVTISSVVLEMIAGIGLIGMTLTVVGLYGLVSYAVSRRTREIGIRIAIGATYARIVRMVLAQGMSPALAGVLAGVVLSVITARLLPGVFPVRYQYDPRLFFLVVPLILGVTVVAALVPARRAARVDPTVALRCE